MGAGDQIDGGGSLNLQAHHHGGQFLDRKFKAYHRLTTGGNSTDLTILTVLAVQRTAAEEDHATAPLSTDRWLFPAMETGPCDPDGGTLTTNTRLTVQTVDPALVWAEGTAAIGIQYIRRHTAKV